jgi:hypothetical protein
MPPMSRLPDGSPALEPDLDAPSEGDASLVTLDEGLTRRTFLRRAGVVAAGVMLGGTAPLWLPARRTAAHGTIETFSGIWGQRTVYEITGNLTSFGYRPSFHDRMGSWLEFWYDNTPTNFLKPIRVWTLGVHNDDRVSEAHNSGRGFDLTRIYATGSDGDLHRRFFGRYDIWQGFDAASLAATRKAYWATAASAHHHFQHVLTYPYDAEHHTHMHIDNLVSGDGNSDFHTDSEAQVLNVQACCRFIWGKSTAVDGVWGPQTRDHSTDVLRRIGRGSGTIATSQANWLAFNRASLRKGYGTEEY